jgi:hypothetical protein
MKESAEKRHCAGQDYTAGQAPAQTLAQKNAEVAAGWLAVFGVHFDAAASESQQPQQPQHPEQPEQKQQQQQHKEPPQPQHPQEQQQQPEHVATSTCADSAGVRRLQPALPLLVDPPTPTPTPGPTPTEVEPPTPGSVAESGTSRSARPVRARRPPLRLVACNANRK